MPQDAATTRTRGHLLQAADAGIAEAERDLFSARRPLTVVAWSIALLVLTAMPSVEGNVDDTAARIAFTALWAAVVAICALRVWQYCAENRRLGARVDAWVDARRDPALRLLDDGDVVLETATVHDVRDRADYESAASDIAFRHQMRQQTLPVVVPTFVLMLTGLVGLGAAIAAALGAGGDLPWAVAVGVAGLVTFAPFVQVVGDMWHAQVQRAAEFTRTGIERRLYAIRRHHLTGAPEPEALGRPVVAQVVVAVLASGGLGILATRVRTSSSLAVLVAAAIVVAVTAIVVGRAWWHGRGVRVYPLDGSGPSVLQSPSRRVDLVLQGDVLTITDAGGGAAPATISLDDVLALEPLSKMSVITGKGLGIVTRDSPIVLTGRGLASDPAVVELRRRFGT